MFGPWYIEGNNGLPVPLFFARLVLFAINCAYSVIRWGKFSGSLTRKCRGREVGERLEESRRNSERQRIATAMHLFLVVDRC